MIEADTNNKWWTWFHWGRVGKDGQQTLNQFTNKQQAIADFASKYNDKTKNPWPPSDPFEKKPGKYAPVEIDYGGDGDDEVSAPEPTKCPATPGLIDSTKLKEMPSSKLDKRLQSLIELICNVKTMQETLIEMEFDIRKMPLGKLTKSNIRKGYDILKRIEDALSNHTTTNRRRDMLVALSNEFYTYV